MPSPNLVRIYLRSWQFVGFGMLIGLVLALAISLLQPLQYSSTVRLLITQTNLTGIDPYTAVKSTERIAQNLSEVVYTSSFFNAVMQDPKVDRNYFSVDEITKRKQWRNAIETGVSAGTGAMTVAVYHTSRTQASEIAVRASQLISELAPNYFGYSVRVQIIDDPLPSRFFARPNFMRNAILGIVLGFLVASAWVLGGVKEHG